MTTDVNVVFWLRYSIICLHFHTSHYLKYISPYLFLDFFLLQGMNRGQKMTNLFSNCTDSSFNLKTIHKCLFFPPYKKQSSIICFTAFKYSWVLAKSWCRLNAWHRKDYISHLTKILRIHVLQCVCFPNVIKTNYTASIRFSSFTCIVHVPRSFRYPYLPQIMEGYQPFIRAERKDICEKSPALNFINMLGMSCSFAKRLNSFQFAPWNQIWVGESYVCFKWHHYRHLPTSPHQCVTGTRSIIDTAS